MPYCSLQRWALLSPPDTSTTECHSCFDPVLSFLLELLVIALCSFPVTYWISSNMDSSSSDVISFCFFHTIHGDLQIRILEWVAISFSSGPCFVRTLHVLAGPARQGHSFTEFCKSLRHDKVVIYERDIIYKPVLCA